MVLRFLAQFKRACNTNEVLKGMALSVMPNFVQNGPASRLAVRMTFRGNPMGE